MNSSLSSDAQIHPPAKATVKLRHCLRCGATFPSEWAGERICSPCKKTVAWRVGAPPQAQPINRRR